MNDFRSLDSTKAIAKRNGVSPGVATRMFRFVAYGNPKLPKVLSIDEFKGNVGRILCYGYEWSICRNCEILFF